MSDTAEVKAICKEWGPPYEGDNPHRTRMYVHIFVNGECMSEGLECDEIYNREMRGGKLYWIWEDERGSDHFMEDKIEISDVNNDHIKIIFMAEILDSYINKGIWWYEAEPNNGCNGVYCFYKGKEIWDEERIKKPLDPKMEIEGYIDEEDNIVLVAESLDKKRKYLLKSGKYKREEWINIVSNMVDSYGEDRLSIDGYSMVKNNKTLLHGISELVFFHEGDELECAYLDENDKIVVKERKKKN